MRTALYGNNAIYSKGRGGDKISAKGKRKSSNH